MKFVFDSSALISIAEKCMLLMLEPVANRGAEILIPPTVYREAVLVPLEKRRYEFNAVRINDLVDRGVIKVEKANAALESSAEEIASLANSMFSTDMGNVRLVHYGEAEALALVRKTGAEVLAIDERTTRELVESPMSTKSYLEQRHRTKVAVDRKALEGFTSMFAKLRLVRSAEIVVYAYESGLFKGILPQTKQALEAALFALKFAGCAVSVEEIKEYLQIK